MAAPIGLRSKATSQRCSASRRRPSDRCRARKSAIATAAWLANSSSTVRCSCTGRRPEAGWSTLRIPSSAPSGPISGANSASSGCQASGSSAGRSLSGTQLAIWSNRLWSCSWLKNRSEPQASAASSMSSQYCSGLVWPSNWFICGGPATAATRIRSSVDHVDRGRAELQEVHRRFGDPLQHQGQVTGLAELADDVQQPFQPGKTHVGQFRRRHPTSFTHADGDNHSYGRVSPEKFSRFSAASAGQQASRTTASPCPTPMQMAARP